MIAMRSISSKLTSAAQVLRLSEMWEQSYIFPSELLFFITYMGLFIGTHPEPLSLLLLNALNPGAFTDRGSVQETTTLVDLAFTL